MAPIKALIMGALTLFPSALAVRLLGTHFSGQIYTFDATLPSGNGSNGSIAITSKTSGCGVTPTWLYLDQETRTLYCFDESWAGSGVITQWKYDPSKGSQALTLSGSANTPGNSVHGSLYGGKDGKSFVITSEYSPSTITNYKLPITSSSKPIQTLEFKQDGPGPRPDRQDRPHPHAAFTDPTGAFMIVPDLGADLTRIFRINKETGVLTSCANIASLPGDGPRHGLFRKTGSALKYYSLNEVSSSIGVYDVSYGSDCLSLTLTQTVSTYGADVKPGSNKDVKSAEIQIVDNDLYASNRNDKTFGAEQDSIAHYKVDEAGKISFQKLYNSYGYYPRSFTFNKAGTYAAIAGQTTANVAIVERDTKTGALGRLVANVNVPPRGTYGGEDGMSSVIWDEPSNKHKPKKNKHY